MPGLGGTCFPARCTGLDETDFEMGWVLEEGTWVLPTPTPYDTEGWFMISYKGFHISGQTYQPAPLEREWSHSYRVYNKESNWMCVWRGPTLQAP